MALVGKLSMLAERRAANAKWGLAIKAGFGVALPVLTGLRGDDGAEMWGM
jgi:hypothetical protein